MITSTLIDNIMISPSVEDFQTAVSIRKNLLSQRMKLLTEGNWLFQKIDYINK